jgi:hypothetical protein
MRATPPILITPAKLTTPAVAEPYDPAAYAGGTTYAFGDIVKVVADFAFYESLAAGNVGNTPNISPLYWRKIGCTETAYNAGTAYAIGDTVSAYHRVFLSLTAANTGNALPVLPVKETAYWRDLGATMRYKMFDLYRSTQTVCPSPLTVVMAPGQRVNTIGITGMSGNSLLVKVTSVSAGGTIYPLAYDADRTYAKGECMTVGLTTCYQSLQDDNVGHAAPNATWWTVVGGAIFDLNVRRVYNATTYCFGRFNTRPVKSLFDVPLVSDPVVTVTLSSASGNVKIGALAVGVNSYIGQLLKPTKNTGVSFSTVRTDIYGETEAVKRRMLRKLTGTLLLPAYLVDLALDLREEFDATPILYVGTEEDGDWTGATTQIGLMQQFDIGTSDGDPALIPFTAQEI